MFSCITWSHSRLCCVQGLRGESVRRMVVRIEHDRVEIKTHRVVYFLTCEFEGWRLCRG